MWMSTQSNPAVNFSWVEAAINASAPLAPFIHNSPIGRSIRLGLSELVNPDETLTIVQIKLAIDPLGDDGALWLPKFREVVEKASMASGYTMSLSGFGCRRPRHVR